MLVVTEIEYANMEGSMEITVFCGGNPSVDRLYRNTQKFDK